MRGRVHPVGGKVVLVTGAALGSGAATARRRAVRGARLARSADAGAALEAVARQGRGAWFTRADVTDDTGLRAAVAAAADVLGGIDVAVVNAGVAAPGLLRFARTGAFEETIAVNLVGAWRTLDAALPHLIARRGYALCVGSVAAVAHIPALAAYSASKAGLEALADALRVEVAHLGVEVGMAYFSWVDTAMVAGGTPGGRARIGSLAVPPLHRVHPVTDAARIIGEAVERRRRAVHHPGWLRAAVPARGLIPPLLECALGATVARMDAAAAARAAARTGDGAPAPRQADERSRRAR